MLTQTILVDPNFQKPQLLLDTLGTEDLLALLEPTLNPTWRFMGSYKWAHKSPNIGYTYSFLTYNPTYNYP